MALSRGVAGHDLTGDEDEIRNDLGGRRFIASGAGRNVGNRLGDFCLVCHQVMLFTPN
jgi:hypothetical protein